jgi:hypothetical protein
MIYKREVRICVGKKVGVEQVGATDAKLRAMQENIAVLYVSSNISGGQVYFLKRKNCKPTK